MKKLIAFFTLLALLAIPVTAMAVKPGDWELVGYTKLETYWDSAQVNKNLSGPVLRNNAVEPNGIGRLRFTAQSSRFGLKVTGPEILGAKTQGYIEVDFDSNQDARQSASNSYIPRMRHAWFRMDWPGGWQLLMGQFWGVFCDFYPETINDGPFQNHGQATQRIPQIRLTYKTGAWTFSGLVGSPYDPAGDNVTAAAFDLIGSQAASAATGAALWGQNSTFPQIQGQIIFEKDLYGKAAYAGAPRGFVFDIGAGVQRTRYMGGQILTAATFGQNGYQAVGAIPLLQRDTQTLTPWVVQGTLFIPVLVTKTASLRNTASITIQGMIGQGFSFFGNGPDAGNSFFLYDSPGFISNPTVANPGNFTQFVNYRRKLAREFGGFIQGQYYFSNEVFVSVVYGFNKAYGITRSQNQGISVQDPFNFNNNVFLTTTASGDISTFTQEIQGNLFWRPHKNLKFGVGYSYLQSNYAQITTVQSKESRFGGNHSVRFGGWFFF